MGTFRQISLICLLLLFFSIPGFAQDPGDNVFHFVKGFKELAPNDNGDMTNIKYLGDTDQDKKGEFGYLTTNGDSCHFVLWEATGDDEYAIVYTYPIIPVWNGLFRDWTAITVGDLNGNGKVEILVGLPVDMTGTITTPNPPRLLVFEWNGIVGENIYGFDNGANPSCVWNFEVPDNYSLVPFHFNLDDIDKDGTVELIADFREPKAIYVVSQKDAWDFPDWQIEWYITNKLGDPNYVNHFDGGGYYGSGVGDLDGDGKRELHVPVWDMWTLNIYECQEPGNFTREAYIQNARSDADYGAIRGIFTGDVNNDGVNELYYVGSDKDGEGKGHVFAISNITDVSQVTAASIVDIMIYPTHPNNTTTRAARTGKLTDADKDGRPDIMVWGSSNAQLYDIEYKGTGDPLDPTSWTFTVAFDFWSYWATLLPDSVVNALSPRFWDGDVAEDMDGDGHREFLICNYSTDQNITPDDPCFYIIEEGAKTGVDSRNHAEMITSYKLSNNFPNPFNPTTTIRYDVFKTGFISLKIFNAAGKEIKSLFEGIANPGEYRIFWDGTNNSGNLVGSGTYFCHLRTDNHLYTHKMTLIK